MAWPSGNVLGGVLQERPVAPQAVLLPVATVSVVGHIEAPLYRAYLVHTACVPPAYQLLVVDRDLYGLVCDPE